MRRNPVRRKPQALSWVGAAGVAVVAGLGLWLLSTSNGATQRPVVINGTAAPPLPTLSAQSVSQGEPLYATYCASCHGANLEGQPNWREPLANGAFPAPPHDDSGHTWHHPDSLLIDITLYGGAAVYGEQGPPSAMPGFEAQLSREEVVAILDFIKSRWSQEARESQWWITAASATR